ncbi:hypothetical protein, partial [Mesorhizobium sp. M8A.F.Ca.ET.165.01.1.1]|uniref:hypothetical protein n=1 Tax=Mesorhizobium sp. M8A.F.Ca.ET.165.01.1.1 TaxID=2563960 RepID=UPI001AEE499B
GAFSTNGVVLSRRTGEPFGRLVDEMCDDSNPCSPSAHVNIYATAMSLKDRTDNSGKKLWLVFEARVGILLLATSLSDRVQLDRDATRQRPRARQRGAEHIRLYQHENGVGPAINGAV